MGTLFLLVLYLYLLYRLLVTVIAILKNFSAAPFLATCYLLLLAGFGSGCYWLYKAMFG
ncbi:putative membrane protein [Collimonas arenae]|uniref:Putative membrane protein n=1 Tax=Collimonas arenae TaxID=279058 RepID=A0A127PWC2_9BURK|nr:hypothetical protein [Collimonas arenae]AMP02093.1 putative membrane protein [Collimonas arenae]AMP11988.1 putative membrane protein [Collimonas arenae]